MINLIITNNNKKINKEKKSQRIKKKLIINNMKANFKFNLFNEILMFFLCLLFQK